MLPAVSYSTTSSPRLMFPVHSIAVSRNKARFWVPPAMGLEARKASQFITCCPPAQTSCEVSKTLNSHRDSCVYSRSASLSACSCVAC